MVQVANSSPGVQDGGEGSLLTTRLSLAELPVSVVSTKRLLLTLL